METTINLQGINIALKSEYLGNKAAKWSHGMTNYNNHKITAKCNGKKLTFDFWGSIAEPEIKKESALIFAFYCFVSDSIAAKETFTDFCAKCGYNDDSINALKIYKACQKSLNKFERVFNDVDIYDFINELQDKHEC